VARRDTSVDAVTESPEVEPAPSVEKTREDLAVTSRTLSFAHRAGYAEGYTDATRSILIVLSTLGFCGVVMYRLYHESK
jgi:hypothetical protein